MEISLVNTSQKFGNSKGSHRWERKPIKLFPTIGLYDKTSISVNLGGKPFLFNISKFFTHYD